MWLAMATSLTAGCRRVRLKQKMVFKEGSMLWFWWAAFPRGEAGCRNCGRLGVRGLPRLPDLSDLSLDLGGLPLPRGEH
jgi:hypothetical protein